jgi:hypothetical protein
MADWAGCSEAHSALVYSPFDASWREGTFPVMNERHRLRLIHLMLVIVVVAVGFAVMPAWGATFFAIGCLPFCLLVGLGRAPLSDLFYGMAFLFVFDWCVSNAVERANQSKKPAVQRALPAAATSGVVKVTPGHTERSTSLRP